MFGMTKALRIAVLGGEGIGPEVVEATVQLLQKLIPSIELVRPLHGEPAIAEAGSVMPAASQEACRQADGILFGATWKHCGDVLRFLRWGLGTYANVRPARSRAGVRSPLRSDAPIDLLIIRENLEGEYPSREGALADFGQRWPEFKDVLGQPMPKEGAFALRIITPTGAERIAEFAAKKAIERKARGLAGKVTIVTKQNVLRKTDGIFKETAERVLTARGVPFDHYYVDDACRRLVAMPEKMDVILTPNLFGDIMSDIASELVGGLGVAPSACIGEKHAYFESVHGSAPDIMGKGIANPLATVLSASMLLEHVGRPREAEALEHAVSGLLRDGKVLTPDMGGRAKTAEVIEELARLATA
jgi:isocitrate/isopropylmalate dehydrogenase